MANFSEAKLQGCSITESDLTETFFSNCRLKKIRLSKNRFVRTEFFKTKLNGIDFSDSVLEGVTISADAGELKGAKVNLYQAAELARMLGIVIVE